MKSPSQNLAKPEVTGFNDLRLGWFRSVAFYYASGCLYASSLMVAQGTNFLFSYLHVAFIASVICLFVSPGFAEGILKPITKNWSHVFLLIFLAYYLVMAFTYPVYESSIEYILILFSTITPGFLIGYVSFYDRGSMSLSKSGVFKIGFIRYFLDFFAIALYCITIYYSYSILTPHLRSDIFLINVPEEQRIYQIFGNYLALSFVLFAHVISPYFDFRYRKSLIATVVWALIVTWAAIASLFLAQMVGSNTGAAIVSSLAAVLLGYRVLREWRLKTKKGRRRAYVVILSVAASVVWVSQILAGLPPLRFFNFEQPSIQSN